MKARSIATTSVVWLALMASLACGNGDQGRFEQSGYTECSECNLANADLRNLRYVDNVRVDLYWANLAKANLSGANLNIAGLRRADLSGADLSGANLTRADLSGADLSGANLTRANLAYAYLIGANLTDADLTDADLAGANLKYVIGADFTGAKNVPAKYLKN